MDTDIDKLEKGLLPAARRVSDILNELTTLNTLIESKDVIVGSPSSITGRIINTIPADNELKNALLGKRKRDLVIELSTYLDYEELET